MLNLNVLFTTFAVQLQILRYSILSKELCLTKLFKTIFVHLRFPIDIVTEHRKGTLNKYFKNRTWK